MVPFAIAVAIAIGAALCVWLLEGRITRNRISVRLIAAMVLVAGSTWMSTIILIPTYFLNEEINATFWFRMRILSMVVMLSCMVVAFAVAVFTATALSEARSIPQWRLCVVPALSLASFATALYLVNLREFWPTA
jgi:hypothetical protein